MVLLGLPAFLFIAALGTCFRAPAPLAYVAGIVLLALSGIRASVWFRPSSRAFGLIWIAVATVGGLAVRDSLHGKFPTGTPRWWQVELFTAFVLVAPLAASGIRAFLSRSAKP